VGVVNGGGSGERVFGCRWALYTFRGFRSGRIPSRVIPAFRRNLNSIQRSAGIVLSIWQVPLPKLIPPEFREFCGFRRIPAGISGGQ
jgi:hypothetical protein